MPNPKRKIINFLLVMTMSLMSFQYAVAGYSMSASGMVSQHMGMMKVDAQQMEVSQQPCHTVEQNVTTDGCDTKGHACQNDCQNCSHFPVGLLSLFISPDHSEFVFTSLTDSRFINILASANIRPPRQLFA